MHLRTERLSSINYGHYWSGKRKNPLKSIDFTKKSENNLFSKGENNRNNI